MKIESNTPVPFTTILLIVLPILHLSGCGESQSAVKAPTAQLPGEKRSSNTDHLTPSYTAGSPPATQPARPNQTESQNSQTASTASHRKASIHPQITFANTTLDLGRIGIGVTNTCEFEFANIGPGRLHITKIAKTCGCTVPASQFQCLLIPHSEHS